MRDNTPNYEDDPSIGGDSEAWLSQLEGQYGIRDIDIDFGMSEAVEREFAIGITPELQKLMQSVDLNLCTGSDGGYWPVYEVELARERLTNTNLVLAIDIQNLALNPRANSPENAIVTFALQGLEAATTSAVDDLDQAWGVSAIAEALAKTEWQLDESSAHVVHGRISDLEYHLRAVVSSITNVPEESISTVQKQALLQIVTQKYHEHIPLAMAVELQELIEADVIISEVPKFQAQVDTMHKRAREATIAALSGDIATICSEHQRWSDFVMFFRQYAELTAGQETGIITQNGKLILEKIAQEIDVPKEAFALAMSRVDMLASKDNDNKEGTL